MTIPALKLIYEFLFHRWEDEIISQGVEHDTFIDPLLDDDPIPIEKEYQIIRKKNKFTGEVKFQKKYIRK